jgi:hypothetical protein
MLENQGLLWMVRLSMGDHVEPMETAIHLPDAGLADAIRSTGATTQREAGVSAIGDFDRAQKVEAFLKMAGSIPDFPGNEKIEAGDMARQKRLNAVWHRES